MGQENEEEMLTAEQIKELRQRIAKVALKAFEAYNKNPNNVQIKIWYAEVQAMLTLIDKIIEPEDEFYAFLDTYEDRLKAIAQAK